MIISPCFLHHASHLLNHYLDIAGSKQSLIYMLSVAPREMNPNSLRVKLHCIIRCGIYKYHPTNFRLHLQKMTTRTKVNKAYNSIYGKFTKAEIIVYKNHII